MSHAEQIADAINTEKVTVLSQHGNQILLSTDDLRQCMLDSEVRTVLRAIELNQRNPQ